MTTTSKVLWLAPVVLLFSSALTQAAERSVAPATQQLDEASKGQSVQSLVWQIKDQRLTVTNTSGKPMQLENDIKLLPDNTRVALNETRVLPGQTVIVYNACPHHLPLQKEVVFTPIADNGQPEATQTLPLIQ